MYGCWKVRAQAHPWEKQIAEVACGYLAEARLVDPRCVGCINQVREVSTFEQLNILHAVGDAAGDLK